MAEVAIRNHASFIWSVADLLRGDYKQSEYGKVILPLVVIRRLDCVLEATKAAVLKRKAELEGRIESWLKQTFGIEIAFKVDEALERLASLGLLIRQGDRLYAHDDAFVRNRGRSDPLHRLGFRNTEQA